MRSRVVGRPGGGGGAGRPPQQPKFDIPIFNHRRFYDERKTKLYTYIYNFYFYRKKKFLKRLHRAVCEHSHVHLRYIARTDVADSVKR